MAEPTFYWHDYETYGLNPRFDRPAQFAGLRTDLDFRSIGDADTWYCECTPEFLPDPMACLLTGITPQSAHAKGALPEVEFAKRIYERMSVSDTINIGYNSMAFDDEVTRHLLWRNLFEPYTREWENGCSRWDLFPFVLAVWALRPEGIAWPEVKTETGKRVSFKLEGLVEANHIKPDLPAHDAANDVRFTIALARFLASKQPRLWKWALENRSKVAVAKAIGSGNPVLWIDRYAGQAKGYIRIVLPIWRDAEANKNDVYVWDCLEDPCGLENLPPEEIRRLAWGKADAFKEGETRLPIRRLKMNTMPFVCENLRVLSEETCRRFGIDLQKVMENAAKLANLASKLQGPLSIAVEQQLTDNEDQKPDVDAALYGGGFIAKTDAEMMQRVHRLEDGTALRDAIGEGRVHFEDDRLQELLFRVRARNWPETLTSEESVRWQSYCLARLEGLVSGTRSLSQYQEEVDQQVDRITGELESGGLDEDAYERAQTILENLSNWGEYVGELAYQNT